MAINIFAPKKSRVIRGLEGKSILIYGDNRTGKTSNAVKADKPLVVAFEYGLEAVDNVDFLPVRTWRDWRDIVSQLTDATKEAQAHEAYQTIIVDTVDAMLNLASDFICTTYGISTIGEDSTGKKGWGRWSEYRSEVSKWINKLTNAGYTVIFIGHTDTRKMKTDAGEEYEKLYPRGDKKSIDMICDLCGIIGYARSNFASDDGKEVYSTLYLKDTPAFKAGGRYDYLPFAIPEWNYSKLNAAVSTAISDQEKETGIKAVDATTMLAEQKAEANKEKEKEMPIPDLIKMIGEKVSNMNSKEGNISAYGDIMLEVLGTKEFRAQEATEKQREQLEMLLEALNKKGY